MSHESKVLIVCCSDPRLVVWMNNYIQNRGWRPMEVDRLINPGVVPALASKMTFSERDVYLKSIKLLRDAHHFEEIVLVTHQDCAAIPKFDDQDTEMHEHHKMLEEAQQNIETHLGLKVKITLIYVPCDIFDTHNQRWLDAA